LVEYSRGEILFQEQLLMEINFRGALTLDEFIQGMKLSSKPISSQSKFRLDSWLLLVLAGSLMTVIGGWVTFFSAQDWGMYLFLAGLFVAVIGIRLRKTPQELWKRNEIYRAQREGVIKDGGVETTTEMGRSLLKWTDFTGYGEYQDVLVLFLDASVEVIFSQRFFQSEEEWGQFKTLVAQKLERSHEVRGKFKLG
jgi:hypothetical protein